MYKIVTKEDTIRIPAEYMRKGASLNDHIDRLSMTAFEGRFDEENRFILVTSNHEPLGRGRIIHGDGSIYQKVRFDAVLFCMDDYEVVEGAVSEVNEFGAFVRIGQWKLCFTSRKSWKTKSKQTSAQVSSKDDNQTAASVLVIPFEHVLSLSHQILLTLAVRRSDLPVNNLDLAAMTGLVKTTNSEL